MNNLDDLALEEGRIALYQLEKQLKVNGTGDASENSVGSRQQLSWNSERKVLDQIPRDARLHNRKGSPLGLTVEELDDRGLLDGGGSIPNYYASYKQRSRRSLEMKKRSSRLEERGKEETSKLVNSFFHMIRVVMNKGFNLEDYCRVRDEERRGLIARSYFMYLVKKIGLPFSPRDIAEILQQFIVPSGNNIDYISFFKCCGLYSKECRESNVVHDSNDLNSYAAVIETVKKMLVHCISSVGRGIDDIYRMFARWDTDGSGTITASQFLRVLVSLRVDLSEYEQDFLVELLDTNRMGRIDFESLLTYCFTDIFPELTSPHGVSIRSLCFQVSDENGHAQTDSLSAVSIEAGILSSEQKSVESNQSRGRRRPHTASDSRAPIDFASDALGDGVSEDKNIQSSFGDHSQGVGLGHLRALKNSRQRPLTAFARVSTSMHSQESKRYSNRYAEDNFDYDDDQVGVTLSDDVLDGEDLHGVVTNVINQTRGVNYAKNYPHGGYDINRHENLDHVEIHDGASFNDNTLITSDQDEFQYGYGSPVSTTANFQRDNWDHNLNSVGELPIHPYAPPNKVTAQSQYENTYHNGVNGENDGAYSDLPSQMQKEPMDHLSMLAIQILGTLREMILSRYRNGKSLHEIFRHFDRSGKRYFDAHDFVKAAFDLRIETSERVAEIAIKEIAIDGIDKVYFGEFKVYVLDPDFKNLESLVQQHIAHRFEKHGREFKPWLRNIFYVEERNRFGDDAQNQAIQTGFVTNKTFIATLETIGLKLGSSDIDRLISRFDVYGQDFSSVTRILRMVESSSHWAHAERVLAYQEEGIREANVIRRQLREGTEASIPGITMELLSMAEYLGIRILSEKHMLWIAADALKAPLPVNWSAQRDEKGRTFFYNHITKQSRWDHPLDPHFRKLRDKYRQSEQETEGTSSNDGFGSRGNRSFDLPSYTGHIGILNPPPINTKLAHPRPQLSDASSMMLGESRKSYQDFSDPSTAPNRSTSRNGRNYSSTSDKITMQQAPESFGSVKKSINDGNRGKVGSMAKPTTDTLDTSQKLSQIIDYLKSDGENPARFSIPNTSQQEPKIYNDLYGYHPRAPEGGNNTSLQEITVMAYSGSSSLRRKYSSVFQRRPKSSGGARSLLVPASWSSRLRPTSAKPQASAVDRVVSYGREIPGYMLPRNADKDSANSPKLMDDSQMNPQLAKMFDDNLIGTLDNIILSNSDSNADAKRTINKPTGQGHQLRTKGGIVVL